MSRRMLVPLALLSQAADPSLGQLQTRPPPWPAATTALINTTTSGATPGAPVVMLETMYATCDPINPSTWASRTDSSSTIGQVQVNQTIIQICAQKKGWAKSSVKMDMPGAPPMPTTCTEIPLTSKMGPRGWPEPCSTCGDIISETNAVCPSWQRSDDSVRSNGRQVPAVKWQALQCKTATDPTTGHEISMSVTLWYLKTATPHQPLNMPVKWVSTVHGIGGPDVTATSIANVLSSNAGSLSPSTFAHCTPTATVGEKETVGATSAIAGAAARAVNIASVE